MGVRSLRWRLQSASIAVRLRIADNSLIIIDAPALAHFLWNKLENDNFVVRPKIFTQICRKYLQKMQRRYRIKMVFDGVTPPEKITTRNERNVQRWVTIQKKLNIQCDDIKANQTLMPMPMPMPMPEHMLHAVFDAAKQFDIETYIACEDADRLLVAIAQQHAPNLVVVLSMDTDFVIFDLGEKGYYIPLDTVEIDDYYVVQGDAVNAHMLATYYRLPSHRLPDLAILLGNDSALKLEYLHDSINQYTRGARHKFNALINHLQRHADGEDAYSISKIYRLRLYQRLHAKSRDKCATIEFARRIADARAFYRIPPVSIDMNTCLDGQTCYLSDCSLSIRHVHRHGCYLLASAAFSSCVALKVDLPLIALPGSLKVYLSLISGCSNLDRHVLNRIDDRSGTTESSISFRAEQRHRFPQVCSASCNCNGNIHAHNYTVPLTTLQPSETKQLWTTDSAPVPSRPIKYVLDALLLSQFPHDIHLQKAMQLLLSLRTNSQCFTAAHLCFLVQLSALDIHISTALCFLNAVAVDWCLNNNVCDVCIESTLSIQDQPTLKTAHFDSIIAALLGLICDIHWVVVSACLSVQSPTETATACGSMTLIDGVCVTAFARILQTKSFDFLQVQVSSALKHANCLERYDIELNNMLAIHAVVIQNMSSFLTRALNQSYADVLKSSQSIASHALSLVQTKSHDDNLSSSNFECPDSLEFVNVISRILDDEDDDLKSA